MLQHAVSNHQHSNTLFVQPLSISNAINLVVLEVDHPVSFVVQPILPQRDRHEQLPSRPFPFMSISPLKIIPSSSRRSRMWARGPFSWWSMGHFHPQAMAALGMSNRFLRAKNASSSPVSFSTLLYYGREEFLPYPLIALFTGASMSLLDALLRKMLFYKKHQWPAVLTLLPRSRSNVQYLNEYSFFHSQKNNAYRTVPLEKTTTTGEEQRIETWLISKLRSFTPRATSLCNNDSFYDFSLSRMALYCMHQVASSYSHLLHQST